jgi:hypothetical protein
VQEHPFAAAGALLAVDNKLARFNRDTKLVLREPCNRQCDSKGTRPRLFDVVRRLLIVRGFCQPVDSALNFFKPKKERMIKNRLSVPRLFLLVSEPVQTNWGPQQHSNDIDAGCLGGDLKISQITCVAAGLE